jgi:hypothetical protein
MGFNIVKILLRFIVFHDLNHETLFFDLIFNLGEVRGNKT